MVYLKFAKKTDFRFHLFFTCVFTYVGHTCVQGMYVYMELNYTTDLANPLTLGMPYLTILSAQIPSIYIVLGNQIPVFLLLTLSAFTL